MKTVIARRIQFCAGHRVLGHAGPCSSLHGHNYVAFFHAEAEELDALGMVIDFSVLKSRLGGWISEHWDHVFIHHPDDHEVKTALDMVRNQKAFELDSNPTAENLARYLLHIVGPQELSGTGVTLVRVVLWETENCFAEVSL